MKINFKRDSAEKINQVIAEKVAGLNLVVAKWKSPAKDYLRNLPAVIDLLEKEELIEISHSEEGGWLVTITESNGENEWTTSHTEGRDLCRAACEALLFAHGVEVVR